MILTLKKVVFMLSYCLKILVLIFIIVSFFIKPLAANDVQIAQELLTKLGYTPGPIDGSYGSKTKFALENFYAAQNKKFDGQLSANEIMSLSKASKNPNFSFEALKMMDDHVEKSELLRVPLPKSNLVIKDYQRFRDYRVQHYVNNYSNWENLWERKGSSGQILNKKYCYDTLANFLIPTSPNIKFKGRSDSDFTRCQHAFLTFGVLNFNA
jgi:peptidoglycan hydrolase-like protein with peptidoglycan-binding domain